jgi:cytoskeletal protein RodZ
MELKGVSFGEELKRERELREITLREVSESTKISLRYLEALERNAFENLPGGVFNRGFVRAYSQFIGIDPESMVDAYILQENTQLGEHRRDGKPAGTNKAGPRRFVWLWWVLGILVVGAVAYWGWTRWQGQQNPTAARPAVEEET